VNIPYFDYAATTPIDPQVLRAISKSLEFDYGNPSAQQHASGQAAAAQIRQARQQLADLINADPAAITWTSGATEANNLAIFGTTSFYPQRGRHIICSATEHSSVLTPCQQLQRKGYRLTLLQPDRDGVIAPELLMGNLQPDTVLVSIQHANNETGVLQDIPALAACLHNHSALLHVDAAQSLGKAPVDVQAMNCDLLSLSAHKVYGPKGIGALYIRRRPRVNLTPMLYGGGQQAALRPGTLPTHQIIGFGKACEIANAKQTQEIERLWLLHHHLMTGLHLKSAKPAYQLNGHPSQRLPGIINLSATDAGNDLLTQLPGYALANGSACNSSQPGPSHVLLAMGLKRSAAANALRISFGRYSSIEEIDHLVTDLNTLGHSH
jgi:cysteine desulfurase